MYGKNRNYVEATVLLEKVLKGYKNLNVKEHHRIYKNAKQSLSAFRGDFSKSSSSFFTERRFSLSSNIRQHVTVESVKSTHFTSDRFLGRGRRRSM